MADSFPLPSSGNISDNGKDFAAASVPVIGGPMNPAPKVQPGVQQKPLESPPVSNVSDSGTKIS